MVATTGQILKQDSGINIKNTYYGHENTLLRPREHPITTTRTPYYGHENTLSRPRGHPITAMRTPYDDHEDTLLHYHDHDGFIINP